MNIKNKKSIETGPIDFVVVAMPKSDNSLKSTKTSQLDLMTAENPAKSFCRMGARFYSIISNKF
ncbi:MAG: hypothetical protein ACKVOA_00375 [Methylophilaceae bacterium]